MGYDLHITRKAHGTGEEGRAITPGEWLAVVEGDPELTLETENGPYFAAWSGPGDYPCWIDYADGELFSKYPTDEFIEKMVRLAVQLRATVQGDDGEVYPDNGQEPGSE